MRRTLIAAFILIMIASTTITQDKGILDCLGPVTPPPDVTFEEWDRLYALPGENIWMGYDYDDDGWYTPLNIGRVSRFPRRWERGEIWSVWVFYSDETPDYTYWFIFSNSSAYDNGAGHYGPHPCGGFRVFKDAAIEVGIDYEWFSEFLGLPEFPRVPNIP